MRRAVSVVAVAALAVLGGVFVAGPTTAASSPSCLAAPATILGTSGDNRIEGTPQADVIFAGRGDDVVLGLGGNDRICGGDGRDRLFGGEGHDLMHGGKMSDDLYGGPGRNRLDGGPAVDLCIGAARKQRCELRARE